MEQLTIIEKEGANYKQFVLEGALNAYTVGEFQDNLYKAVTENNVVLDMSKLIELDPSGLGVLMAAYNDCEEAGYKLYFMSMSNESERTISGSGFKSLFHMITSVTEVK
ncbi:MAG: STAS domain-containing protein [Treponema sp.]|nr:STAS domain-containing protein [Treponema sp.]